MSRGPVFFLGMLFLASSLGAGTSVADEASKPAFIEKA